MSGHDGMGGHGHGAMSGHDQGAHHAGPTLPGQDAFGAIAEIVAILDADRETDWSRVDLERLRQHLIDMNEVVLRAQTKARPVPGGIEIDVTGAGRTALAIRRMLVPHAGELEALGEWSAQAVPIPGGVRLTVVARRGDDGRAVARIRGLGFPGLLATGAHHQTHHLAMARGEAMGGHRH
jgi:hypothetical protein